MSTTRSIGQMAWICLGAWLLWATGCVQAGATARQPLSGKGAKAGVGEVDPSIPRASLVSLEDDPNAVAVSSTIRKVTVYSDRALVRREAAVKVTTQPTVFAFRHLPGWVDDGSVRAATTAGRILDVRVGRSYLAQATEKSYRKAEAHARVLADRLLALDDELKVLDAQTKQVEDIKAFSMDKLNKDVALGNPKGPGNRPVAGSVGVTTYAAVVNFIAKKMREIAKGRRAVQAERKKLAPKVKASNRRLEDLRGLTQLEETKVFVTVQGKT